MKIVNINDIEDLILAKHEIDLMLIDDKIIDKRTELKEFILKYATPDNIYIFNGITIPFKLYKLHDKCFLFVTNYNKNEIDILTNKIKLLKYDLNNLIEIKFTDMLTSDNSNDNVIIIDNKYYK